MEPNEVDPLIAGFERKREASGFSQVAVSARAGIPHSTLWRIAKGDGSPRLDTLRKLEAALEELIAEAAS